MGAGPERSEASSSEARASQESGKASGAQDLRGRASAQLAPGLRSAPEGPRGARAVRHLRPSASLSVSRGTLGAGAAPWPQVGHSEPDLAVPNGKSPERRGPSWGMVQASSDLCPLPFPHPSVSERPPLPTPRVVPTPLPPPFRRARSHTLLPADQPIPVKVRIFARASLGRPSDRPRTVSGRE